MKNTTKNIYNLPHYLLDSLREQDLAYKEQVRVKEYSKREPVVDGTRTVFLPWSGGLDSTTSLLMAIESGLTITTVFMNYGQPYIEKELLATKTLQKLIKKHYPDNKWENHITLNAQWIDEALKKEFTGEWGHIFPMRNFIILEETALLAKEVPFSEIWFSCVQGEIPFSGGDKSIVFITHMKSKLGAMNINLTTPLIGLNKGDMVAWAAQDPKRFEITSQTISCFNGEGKNHCGKCQACFNRAVGFFSVGKLDESGIDMSTAEFKEYAKNYVLKLQKEEYYSPTRKEQLQKFIASINHD